MATGHTDPDGGLVIELLTSPEDAGERLDTVLTRELQRQAGAAGTLEPAGIVPTRSKIVQWISEGRVQVDGALPLKPGTRLKGGEAVRIALPHPAPSGLQPDSAVPFSILFEDDELLVLDKPAGVVVHPGAGTLSGTLLQGLLAHIGDGLKAVGDALRPGIVHRLDKDTSGCMVVAKTDRAYLGLVAQFRPPRTIGRTYLAVTARLPRVKAEESRKQTSGIISAPIGRHPIHRKRMAVIKTGKEARTEWRLVESLGYGALLELRLETGRTHQIRVHLQHEGAPILGDPVYGEPVAAAPDHARDAVRRLNRQALHAAKLSFIHPVTNEALTFEAPIPADIAALLAALR